MGISGLFGLIAKEAPGAITTRRLQDYAGKCIAVDATLAIYQWCSVGESRNIRNAAGKYINHIQGLFFRSVKMLAAGIIPFYIFDGQPPAHKEPTLAARRAIVGRIKVPTAVYEECKRLLDLMGIPWIQAPAEAEAQGSRVPAAAGIMTEDSDAILFGAPLILRMSGDKVIEYDVGIILRELHLTAAELIDMCILAGTDYNTGTMTIGRAYKLVRGHAADQALLRVPNINEIRQLFIAPEVGEVRGEIQVRPSKSELREYLVGIHGLNTKKVDNALAKIM